MNRNRKFALAVSGEGALSEEFLAAVRARLAGIRVYDRNEEASRPPSSAMIPAHPEVADVDAIFHQAGGTETLTLRSVFGHRLFNYRPSGLTDPTSRRLLIEQMVRTVEGFHATAIAPRE